MKTIILPIDFGESTYKLISSAIDFAKQINGKIFLIHVAPSDIGFAIGEMGYQYFPDIEQVEMQNELQQLKELEQKISNSQITCDHILKQGAAKDVILEFASEKNADYIVMGSHGRSGIYDVFVGSLTKDITKASKIPVLVIPCQE